MSYIFGAPAIARPACLPRVVRQARCAGAEAVPLVISACSLQPLLSLLFYCVGVVILIETNVRYFCYEE
ncbi:hypothetical protein E2C01_044186 [Portunus trituberculatus]|uniref:Uncharacterized protein n=1 Tax=Portunus trituberculatus TaxID=210409 RepID=A0A5B7FZQ4_PORTR|nr:hypothetical protein [Portunus trituberculatus]